MKDDREMGKCVVGICLSLSHYLVCYSFFYGRYEVFW